MKLIFIIFIFFAQLKDTKQQKGGLKFGNLRHLHRHRLDVLPQATLELDREIQCVSSCLKKKDCFSFNLKKTTGEKFLCEFLNTTKFRNHDNLTKDDDYVHWYFQQPCLVHPCNTGTCIQSDYESAGYICDCVSGLYGQQCEHYDSSHNFALGKPTAQSSTWFDNGYGFPYPSYLAVDGYKTTNLVQDGTARCTHTLLEDTVRWWRVDFQHEIPVSRVVITNRGECCGERLGDFEIKIGNSLVDEGTVNPKCGERHGVGVGITATITCSPPLFGRYLMIQSFFSDGFSLCELEVYV